MNQLEQSFSGPRIEMILGRWRRQSHRSPDVFPDDEEMLELMLEDDALHPKYPTFEIQKLGEDINRFTKEGKLILGVCNGFQVLVKASILPNPQGNEPCITLTTNDSGCFVSPALPQGHYKLRIEPIYTI